MRTYKSVSKSITVQSFGGGVQSVALFLINLRVGREFIPVFANVGDRAENPATIKYIHEYIIPICRDNWIPFVETKSGDLYDDLVNNPHPCIPVFAGKSQLRRICTSDRKIKPVNAAIKRLLKNDENAALVQIGISVDEIHRAKFEDWRKQDRYGRYFGFWQKPDYPLIDAGMSRDDCIEIIKKAGLPVPDKSACWFCPFGSGRTDAIMRLETGINKSRGLIGLDEIQIRRAGVVTEECGGYCDT